MASLVESGVKNLNFGDADSVGFFQMRVGIWNQGEYAGFPEKPELQAKWFLDQAEAVKKQRISRGQSVTDPNQFGNWIADVERPAEQYRGRYQLRLDEARGLLAKAGEAPAAPAAPAAAAAAGAPAPGARPPPRRPPRAGAAQARRLRARSWPPRPKRRARPAAKKAGSGTFMAAQAPAGPASAVAAPGAVPGMVDAAAAAARRGAGRRQRLGAAALRSRRPSSASTSRAPTPAPRSTSTSRRRRSPPGNPWCASFVTWALEQAGHKMDGGGWAAVQTWVRNAEAGKNDLKIVSADQARPGDIVAYDWGHQDDFGSDGHIGFLASEVKGGKFTALEGNNQDQVMKVPRDTSQANVKFIRIGGDTPAAAAPAAPPAAGRRRRRGRRRRAAAGGGGGLRRLPGRQRLEGPAREWMGDMAEKRGLPRSSRSWPRSSSPASRTSTSATPTRSASSRCASGSGTRAPTRASRRSPSCRSSGSSTRPRRSRSSASPAASRSPTPTSSATGSPTSSAPPRSTAAATSCASRRPTGCSAEPARRRPRPPPSSRPPPRAPAAPAAAADAAASAAGGWRRRRPEGARRAQGGPEVHRHRVQVGRLDAADRLRLLRSRAVGVREGRHPDPARDRRAVRRLQRHVGRSRRPQAGRPRLLRRAGQHLPRRDLDGRGQVPARAEDRRRRQGREPEGVLLLHQLRGREALRQQRAGGSRGQRGRRPAPRRRPPPPSTRRRSPRRRPRSRATPPRSTATARASSWR